VARRALAFGAATKTGSAVVVALTGTANAPQFTGRWQVDLVSPGLPAQPFHAAAALEPIAAEALVVQLGQATEEAAAAALRSAVGGSPVIGVAVVKMVSIRGEVTEFLRSTADASNDQKINTRSRPPTPPPDHGPGRPRPVPLPLPNDLPVTERSAVRLVVLDARDRVLLFHTRDQDHPDLGTWWELPGGGIDLGETYLDAALRGAARGDRNRRRTFPGRATHIATSSIISTPAKKAPARRSDRDAATAVRGPDIDESRRLGYEGEEYFDFRWWPTPEILNSRERFYPGQLPALLGAFLDVEQINEPFELWS